MRFLQITNTFRKQPGSLEQEQVEIPCRILFSDRKTIALQIEESGQVTVRVPRTVTAEQALSFAQRHEEWILRTRERMLQSVSQRPVYTDAEIQEGKRRLKRCLEERLPVLPSEWESLMKEFRFVPRRPDGEAAAGMEI